MWLASVLFACPMHSLELVPLKLPTQETCSKILLHLQQHCIVPLDTVQAHKKSPSTKTTQRTQRSIISFSSVGMVTLPKARKEQTPANRNACVQHLQNDRDERMSFYLSTPSASLALSISVYTLAPVNVCADENSLFPAFRGSVYDTAANNKRAKQSKPIARCNHGPSNANELASLTGLPDEYLMLN